MSSQGRAVVLLTGASMGIGHAIAAKLAANGFDLVLMARSESKLQQLAEMLQSQFPACTAIFRVADIGDSKAVDEAVSSALRETGRIDILINNAGLALGAPATFNDLSLADINTMINTNINGMLYVTYAVLNQAFLKEGLGGGSGTILNVTSITGLEVPPFPGEAIYHASKAFQEGFTNSLRNELSGTNVRVLALRPGCVATNFHSLRVGHDQKQYEEFFAGFEPLEADNIASTALYMLQQPLNVSIKALDVVPTAQRSLTVFDREWTSRNSTNK